jgi:hypothetical protein
MAVEWKLAFIGVFSVCVLKWFAQTGRKRCRPWSINASPRQNLSMMFFVRENPPARPPPDAVDLMNPASQPTAVRHDDHAATESGAVNG